MRVCFDYVLDEAESAIALKAQHRFGMELNGLYRQLAMTNAHNDAVVRFGRDLKTVWERFSICVKRVIAANTKWRGQIMKDALPMVNNLGGFPMHGVFEDI